jgi:hypothetical protein
MFMQRRRSIAIALASFALVASLALERISASDRPERHAPAVASRAVAPVEARTADAPRPAPLVPRDPAPPVAAQEREASAPDAVADFDPGYGEVLVGVGDDAPSPSYEEIAREEAALPKDPARVAPGRAPDFRALGYASAADLEASMRRAFGVSADRHVELRAIEADGRRFVTLTASPPARAVAQGPIAAGRIHRMEPIRAAADGELTVAIESTGGADAYLSVGAEPTEYAHGWRLGATSASDAVTVPVRSGESLHVMVEGREDGAYVVGVQ